MSIDPQKAEKLIVKFKNQKGDEKPPLSDDFALKDLVEAVERGDLVHINKTLAKSILEGLLSEDDLGKTHPQDREDQSTSPVNKEMAQARYRAIVLSPAMAISKQSALFNSWSILANMGALHAAARDVQEDPEGWGNMLTGVHQASKAFFDSARGHSRDCKIFPFEGGNPLPEDIHRVAFKLKGIAHWGGEEIENASPPVRIDFDQSSSDRVQRIRLGDHGYVELATGSYYDDERTHSYTNGAFFICASKEGLSSFISTRTPLLDLETFLFNAKHDTAAMIAQMEAGIPADICTEHDFTRRRAIAFACSSHNESAILKLLEAGANPSGCPGEYETPLGALMNGSKGVDSFYERLQPEIPDPEDESRPSFNNANALRCVQHLIDAGVDVNQVYNTFRMNTPLMFTCDARNVDLFAMLLKGGADVDVVTKGMSVMEYAKSRKAHDIVSFNDAWKANQMIDGFTPAKKTSQPGF